MDDLGWETFKALTWGVVALILFGVVGGFRHQAIQKTREECSICEGPCIGWEVKW